MRVLLVHNFYQMAGGEDAVFRDEAQLLRDHGHDVFTWRVHNRTIHDVSKLKVAVNAVWSGPARRKLRDLVRRRRIEVVHFHNTFPLLSASVYGGAHAEGAATVQTLHNYRMLCPSGLLLRGDTVCEKCVGRMVPTPAVVFRCYRGSFAGSAAVATMLTTGRAIGAMETGVDRFIALTEFSRRKFIEGGLPAERVVVKPNFLVRDPGAGDGRGGYALFVGRLSPEKGVAVLLEAWRRMPGAHRLVIVGDGPLAGLVQAHAAADARIEWRPHQPQDRVLGLMQEAALLIAPSQWYEGLPRVFVEAMACGTPVIASRLGGLTELLDGGDHGRCFTAGDARQLAAAAAELLNCPERLSAMRAAARRVFLDRYTAEANYAQLMSIYGAAVVQWRTHAV